MEWLDPRVAIRSRAARGDERAADASRTDLEGLSNHVLARDRFLGKGSIGFQNQRNGLLQVDPGLFKGCALRVRAREFLNECDVTLRNSPENSSELKIHGNIIRRQRRLIASAFGLKHWGFI